MEYQVAKDYLDNLIRVQNEAKSSAYFNSSIQAIIIADPESVHMYRGIEIIADVMGLTLGEREWRYKEDVRTEYFFIYSGVEFFQLGSSDDPNKA